jgi:hypothetical protein
VEVIEVPRIHEDRRPGHQLRGFSWHSWGKPRDTSFRAASGYPVVEFLRIASVKRRWIIREDSDH